MPHTAHRHFPQLVITNKKIREWVVVLLNLIFFAASFSTVLATFWHEEWLTHAEPTLTAHDDTSVLRISLLSVKSVAGQLLYQNSPIRVKNFMEFWTFSSWLWYACKNQSAKNETIPLPFFTTVHKTSRKNWIWMQFTFAFPPTICHHLRRRPWDFGKKMLLKNLMQSQKKNAKSKLWNVFFSPWYQVSFDRCCHASLESLLVTWNSISKFSFAKR